MGQREQEYWGLNAVMIKNDTIRLQFTETFNAMPMYKSKLSHRLCAVINTVQRFKYLLCITVHRFKFLL